MNEGVILKAIALRNVQKWGNIKRTIRDLQSIEDFESDKAAGESTAEVLKNFLSAKNTKQDKVVSVLEKLDDRLTALESK